MKKLFLFCILMGMFSSAYAMTYFLEKQWYQNGNQMCQYGNGAVLNVGVSLCPLSING
jgi:hypothetical protein